MWVQEPWLVSLVPTFKCKRLVTFVLIVTSSFCFVFWYVTVFHTVSQDDSLEAFFPKLNFLHWFLLLYCIPSLWRFIQEVGLGWTLCCKKLSLYIYSLNSGKVFIKCLLWVSAGDTVVNKIDKFCAFIEIAV